MKRTYQRPEPIFLKQKLFFMSLVDPVCWLINKQTESILDVACGQGLPMRKIRARLNIKYAVGVDSYKPYIEECKLKKLHNKYFHADIRNIRFEDNSFDVVLALQVLEHLTKQEAWKVLEKLERIAKKQVIIATPIGFTYHQDVDDNKHQDHQSAFYPKDFEKKGYKVIRMGRVGLLGHEGLEYHVKNNLFKQFVYMLSIVIDGLCIIFPKMGNYYFVAVKNKNE
jgi:ubiquinone/menaquinone biosynthesis C-methylase UbiE